MATSMMTNRVEFRAFMGIPPCSLYSGVARPFADILNVAKEYE